MGSVLDCRFIFESVFLDYCLGPAFVLESGLRSFFLLGSILILRSIYFWLMGLYSFRGLEYEFTLEFESEYTLWSGF